MKNIFLLLATGFVFLGCGKTNNSNSCTYDSCVTKAPASEIASVQAYLASNSISATQHCSGLFYAIDDQGTGTTPSVCNTVVVNYQGRLTNGTIFDQTTTASGPAVFNLSGLITGFKNGIPLIKAGGKIRLYVPPSLGYGNQQVGTTIPPNSILIFNVELLRVQ